MSSSTPVLKKGSKGEAVTRLQEGCCSWATTRATPMAYSVP